MSQPVGGSRAMTQPPKPPARNQLQNPFRGHIAGTVSTLPPLPPLPPIPRDAPGRPSHQGPARSRSTSTFRSIDEPDNIHLNLRSPGTRPQTAHARSKSNPNGVPNFSRNAVLPATRLRSKSNPDRLPESHRPHDQETQHKRQRTNNTTVRPERIPPVPRMATMTQQRQSRPGSYDVPDSWLNLSETTDGEPVPRVEEPRALNQNHVRDRADARKVSVAKEPPAAPEDPQETKQEDPSSSAATATATATAEGVSRPATHLYTVSYLIFFSLMGTLARIGLQALTTYPGAPVFPSVWFNFGGCVVMGFLAEDRKLFRNEWGTPTYHQQIQKAARDQQQQESSSSSGSRSSIDLPAAKKAHLAVKKTIPLYIGLATGFCGSFTSFSSFIRDTFLALSNDLVQPGAATAFPRNDSYSVMAVLAVVIITVSASLSGLFVGAHLAIAATPITPSFPYRFTRHFLDPATVVLAWGSWVGAALLTALPPHQAWRGQVTFALLLAPVGALVRFYVSLWLNARRASFPLGTFAVNVLGTAVLGMAWDLQRASPHIIGGGGVIACQALQGVEDGFCGCMTTVSTWVAELAALRRRHAWIYGAASVGAALAVMVAVMGGLRWTQGFAPVQCIT